MQVGRMEEGRHRFSDLGTLGSETWREAEIDVNAFADTRQTEAPAPPDFGKEEI